MLHSSLLPQNLWTTNEKMGDTEKVREILVGMMAYFELYIYVQSVTLDVLFLRSIYHAITQGSGINIQNAATPILNFRVWGMVGQGGRDTLYYSLSSIIQGVSKNEFYRNEHLHIFPRISSSISPQLAVGSPNAEFGKIQFF